MSFNKIWITLLMLISFGSISAQHDQTLFNMRWTPQAMYQNPARIPLTKVNIGLPVLSSIYGNVAHTGFTWKNLIELTPDDSLELTVDNMLSKLGKRNLLNVNAAVDLIHVGFRTGEAYVNFSIRERMSVRMIYPEDFMGLIWQGNGAFLGETADLSGLGADVTHYREIGLGYARPINEKIWVGGKLKLNNGVFNINTKRSNIGLFTDSETFDLTATSDFLVNTSGFAEMRDSSYEFDPAAYLLKGNMGLGIDLGMTYELNDDWRFSASVVDLGFIRWGHNVENFEMKDASFTFSGLNVNNFNFDSLQSSHYTDSLLTALEDSVTDAFDYDSTGNKYSSGTIPRFSLAANYNISEKVDAGLLFTGEIYKGSFRPAITASLNTRLGRVLQASLSYSYMNRSPLNIGFGFSVNAGPVQLYAVSDNILAPMMVQGTKTAHAHIGLNLTIGRESRDKDGDGIIDKEDECPDEFGLLEFNGCPDRDGDKIIDKNDACPDVPGIAMFNGCPDTDKDGVVDSLDACPTIPGVKELDGCPDRDGDKIVDSKDACPDEAGPIATKGCPDKDGDGVIDREDLCPEKPGLAVNKGCPDTDGDGLFDHEDRCPEEAGPIDNKGCPYGDLDGDGVLDKEDRCPDTPGPAANKGCPYGDLDGDGVTDNEDECPNTPGTVALKGCPEIAKEDQDVIDFAFNNLEFESGKTVIRATSYPSLDSLASLLTRKADWKLNIAGHTDNIGSDAINMGLSEGRSKAVRDYLVSRGIVTERLTAEWFGESKPLYPNDTPEGRQKNRRVEMTIKFD